MATITRLSSGKYRAQMRRFGVYKARTFDRKSDATHWASDVERAIASGAKCRNDPSTRHNDTSDVIDAYLKQVTTGRTARFNFERSRDRIGKTSIRNLNATTVQSFMDSRLAEGVTGETLAGDLSVLSSTLKWARHARQIDLIFTLAKNARTALTVSKIDTRINERTRIPTADEIDRICAYFDNNLRQKIPMNQIVRFAESSAMKLGEICRIRIEDINWNEKFVLIRERKDPKRKARNDQRVPLVGTSFYC